MRFEEVVDRLNKEPNEKNWQEFAKYLPKSKAKYYRIVYTRLKKADDLTKSYAELYDSKKRLVAKVPIYKKAGKKVEGATIYLKGLTNWVEK